MIPHDDIDMMLLRLMSENAELSVQVLARVRTCPNLPRWRCAPVGRERCHQRTADHSNREKLGFGVTVFLGVAQEEFAEV